MEKDQCYFCGEKNTIVLNEHYIVPERISHIIILFEEDEVVLCSNCHRKLHHLIKPFVDYIQKNYIAEIGDEKPIEVVITRK